MAEFEKTIALRLGDIGSEQDDAASVA